MSVSLSTAHELRSAYVKGIGEAQRVAREAILSVVESVRPGDSERKVVARVEREFRRAKVSHWLHTPYAWWGERTRFDWHGRWETNALPSDRVLQDGEAFVLDAAPIVAGFPADFAYSGLALGTAEDKAAHARLLQQLTDVKRELVRWASEAPSGAELCTRVASAIADAGLDVIHTRYPAQVLALKADYLERALNAGLVAVESLPSPPGKI